MFQLNYIYLKAIDKISQLIKLILNDDENKHIQCEIGRLSRRQASAFYNYTGVDVKKATIIIDSSAIRHTIRKHSVQSSESKRGQIAVQYDDFTLIPTILSYPDIIEYKGKNNLKQEVFSFNKNIRNIYIVVLSVRLSKKGNKVAFSTLYIRKQKADV